MKVDLRADLLTQFFEGPALDKALQPKDDPFEARVSGISAYETDRVS